ncbi:hypothetical protein SAMN05216344_13525 [Polaromonas sp. OV174]|nr:hypothetical protein SAMN05216344_13525 [Polaromonas sp. OV174]
MLTLVYGAVVGLVLGLTGAGGGILAVPALVLGMGWPPQAATPVALLAVGFSAALGAFDGLRKGLVRWRAALLMASLGICFSPLGVWIAHALPQPVLMTLFAAAMFFAAARLLRQNLRGASPSGNLPAEAISAAEKNCVLDPSSGRLRWTSRCAATLSCIGSCSGLLTGMLGVGGGFLIVPAFRQWTDIRMHGVVATSLLVIALVSLGATVSALHAGAQVGSAGLVFILAAMTGMLAGRQLAPRVRSEILQISFASLSIAVAVALLYRTWLP